MNRPRLCPDEDCQIIFFPASKEQFKKGASYVCWGKMQEPHLFIERETRHVNPYSYCVYTPLKGHIRFFICFEDAWTDFLGFAKVMDIDIPLVCDVCGPIVRHGNTLYGFIDKTKLCSMCAVRLGKITWHEKERRYY